MYQIIMKNKLSDVWEKTDCKATSSKDAARKLVQKLKDQQYPEDSIVKGRYGTYWDFAVFDDGKMRGK